MPQIDAGFEYTANFISITSIGTTIPSASWGNRMETCGLKRARIQSNDKTHIYVWHEARVKHTLWQGVNYAVDGDGKICGNYAENAGKSSPLCALPPS